MVGPKIIAALDVYSIGILYTRTRAYVNGGVGLAPSRPLEGSVPFFTPSAIGEDAKLDATPRPRARVVGVAL